MNKLEFGIIAPSYAPEFERCQLLSRIVQKFISLATKHYIMIDPGDFPLFCQLKIPYTEIIAVKSMLMKLPTPGYIGKIIIWQRENLLQLYEHIKSILLRDWMKPIWISLYLLEYILYGTFVDQLLQEQSGHYSDLGQIYQE